MVEDFVTESNFQYATEMGKNETMEAENHSAEELKLKFDDLTQRIKSIVKSPGASRFAKNKNNVLVVVNYSGQGYNANRQ